MELLRQDRKRAVKAKPPFKSKSTQDDTANFHRAFTTQRPVDSLGNEPAFLSDEQQAHFDGFTYVPETPRAAPAATSGAGGAASPSAAAVQQVTTAAAALDLS